MKSHNIKKNGFAAPAKNFSSPGRGNRKTRGRNDEQHKRSKTTPKSYTLTPGLATSRRESAEEQGLRRRILDPGKVMRVHIQTTEKWLKDSCRYFISLAMAYKFDFHFSTSL